MNFCPKFRYQTGSIAVIVVVAILSYSNSLKGAFQFDDANYINHPRLSSFERLFESVSITHLGARPVLLASFALNNSLHPGQVFGFHLVNVLIHVWVCLLIFCLIWRSGIFATGPQDIRSPTNRPHSAVALGTALLFAVHPLNTETVSYISSRSSALATFFYLLALWFFLEGYLFNKNRWKIGFGLAGTLAFLLAVGTKLIALSLPIIIIVAVMARILPDRESPTANAQPRNWKGLLIASIAVLIAGFLLLPEKYFSPIDFGPQLFGRLPYFLVQVKIVLTYYFKLFLFPFNLNLDVGYPFSNLTDDGWIAGGLIFIAVIVIYAWRTGPPWFLFATSWFFITLSPTSTIIPLSDLAVEHRTYLPMTLGLCLFGAGVIFHFHQRVRIPFLILLLILMSATTLHRNRVWVNEFRLWSDAAEKNPGSPRTRNNLGKAYYERSALHRAKGNEALAMVDRERALLHFQKSVDSLAHYAHTRYNTRELSRHLNTLATPELKQQLGLNTTSTNGPANPGSLPRTQPMAFMADFAEPHFNLASAYLDMGRLEGAQKEYEASLKIAPDYYASYLGLGSVYNQKEDPERAIDLFQQAIEAHKKATGGKDYALARINLGEVYGKLGQFDRAIEHLKVATGDASVADKAWYNLAIAYLGAKQLREAEQAYLNCLEHNPDFFEAWFNLGALYQKRGDWAQASQLYQLYLDTHARHAGILFQYAWSEQHQGHWQRARDLYSGALAVDPNHHPARMNLAGVYMQLEKWPKAIETLEQVVRYQPGNFHAHKQLGQLYWQTRRDGAKARQHLRQAGALSPSVEESQMLARLLKQIPPS